MRRSYILTVDALIGSSTSEHAWPIFGALFDVSKRERRSLERLMSKIVFSDIAEH